MAAIEGHEGVMNVLLEREDVDLNLLDDHNRTLLARAAISRHQGIVIAEKGHC